MRLIALLMFPSLAFAAPVPKQFDKPEVELKLSAKNQLVLEITVHNHGKEPLELPYRFTPLDDLLQLQQRLHAAALAQALKGTVLLAPEGINLSVSGPERAVRDWAAQLDGDPAFAGLDCKEGRSPQVAFKRWRVRIR